MLQSIRDRAQSLVVGVIVLFLCLTFALWGIEQYVSDGRDVLVADVDGDEIKLSEFQQAYQRYRQQAQAMLGEAFDAEQWQQPETRQKALDKLVEEHLLAQVAGKAGLHVSDRQVQEQLRRFPAFQQDGMFARSLYEERVRMMGYSEVTFEQRMRADMVLAQLQAGVVGSGLVTTNEARRLQRLRAQKRDLGYAIVPAESFKKDVTLSAADIEGYYTEHKPEFATEQKMSLETLELSITGLMDQVVVDDPKLQNFYAEHEADYTAEEERSANHILIQVPASATADEQEAARKKAAEIRDEVVQSGDFERVAMARSDDVGSRAEGGATGFFRRGSMAPEFEQAVFAMTEGEISEPVRSQFGYHIIRLNQIKKGGVRPFANVRQDVEQAYRRAQAEQLYYDQAEQLSNLLYEHPDTLGIAAETLGLSVSKTEVLTVAELSERVSPAVASAAVSDEVLVDGLNSEPIEVGDGRVLAIRIAEHQPSRALALDEVKDRITNELTERRARALAEQRGVALVERLRAGEPPEALFKAEGLTWTLLPGIDRASPKISRAIARAAFKAPPPAAGALTITGALLGSGDYGVIAVSNVQEPAAEDLDKQAIEDLKKVIAQYRAAVDWRAFVLALKSRADVDLFPGNL